jgi:ankyrin repeat protein
METMTANNNNNRAAHPPSLIELLCSRNWTKAMEMIGEEEEEEKAQIVSEDTDPSPLAMACRCGAPLEVIRALLTADPMKIRHVVDSRGTPLHEAIGCELTSLAVLAELLKADEALGTNSKRATLLQDVDGFTPLHVLIRRRFQDHILQQEQSTNGQTQADDGSVEDRDGDLMNHLQLLVQSCPEAIIIPDRGEYEEPPIVYALKAYIYAPLLGTGDETAARIERQIYDMVACMLHYLPQAASCVFNGYRGQYTALHSAVFHGRATRTIELLLQARSRCKENDAIESQSHPSALLANTQGELPLHFCTMRGERPRMVDVIAKAAPEAVEKRDVSGLTPFHWLWIRYVSTLLALEDSHRQGIEERSFRFSDPPNNSHMVESLRKTSDKYNCYWTLEQGDFERDLQLIRTMDPPVDFLRMRHIPSEAHCQKEVLQWVERSATHLECIRRQAQEQDLSPTVVDLTRQQVVMCNFWAKVISLLQAAHTKGTLTHTAFSVTSCPAHVVELLTALFPEDLAVQDEDGFLPIHCAASRPWHVWDVIREERGLPAASETSSVLRHETLNVFKVACRVSSSNAFCVFDKSNRLVLHHLIDTLVNACLLFTRFTPPSTMIDMLDVMQEVVRSYPSAMEIKDGVTNLYPFLQATATASTRQDGYWQEERALSITYSLLRLNPSVLGRLRTDCEPQHSQTMTTCR